MSNWWIRQAFVASMIIGIIGCGGAGIGVSTGGGTAGGGIGGTGAVAGTGIGEITGFGSIKLDDDGIFDTDGQTRFFIDDVELDNEAAFRAVFGGSNDSVGAVAIVQIRDDVDDDFTTGTAARVEAHSTVKGPVTGINPLQVLGQEIVVTSDTVLADLSGGVAALQVGDQVEIYGFRDSDTGVILATRLQFKTAGSLQEWKLTGFVATSGANTFNVGSQTVSLAVTQASDCGASPPPVGRFVEVKANPLDHSGFTPGDELIASDVECKARGLFGRLDYVPDATLRKIQGFISEVAGNSFTVGGVGTEGQSVSWTATTVFRNGSPEDLVVGAKVEVVGQFNTSTGVLTAARVSFRETRVRIEAPLLKADVDVSQRTAEIIGIIVRGTALTRDEDNIYAGALPDSDVRVEGFVDRDGTVFATRIEDRGTINTRDLRLRGPVDDGSIIEPNFSILGVRINPGAGTQYRVDLSGSNSSVDQATFFANLFNGAPVQVDADPGSFNAAGPSIDLPTEIELED